MWTRRLQTPHCFLAALASAQARSAAAFSSPSSFHQSARRMHHVLVPRTPSPSTHLLARNNRQTPLQMSFFGGPAEGAIQRIDRAAMTEIIDDVANSSREESGYVVIDVRGEDEIRATGKLNDCVETLPLPYIAEGALAMDDEDFEERFGFVKPALDETLVFSCKAGIRSQHAGQFAKMAGYTNIVDYMGGSDEWFS
ncbi:hypothetical protein ACHAXT_009948 [Thalassiosira profunda]